MTDLELRNLLPRGLEDILRLQRYLNHALDHLDQLPTPFTDLVSIDATNDSVAQARTDLAKAHNSVATIRDWMIELCRLLERMADQRQLAADAFAAGYNARYVDLIARLSGPEYYALRQALLKLDDEDQIPF